MTSSYSHYSGCGLWVVDREFVIWVAGGCALWCWVVGGCALWSWIVGSAGLRILDMGCGLRVVVDHWLCSVVVDRWLCWVANLWYGLRVASGRAGLRVAVSVFGFSDGETKTRDERQRRESQIKYYYFFYNTCYSAILCLELHCSSIAKKFAILLFSILQCRWFWGLKFQISLRFGISILQC